MNKSGSLELEARGDLFIPWFVTFGEECVIFLMCIERIFVCVCVRAYAYTHERELEEEQCGSLANKILLILHWVNSCLNRTHAPVMEG